MRNWPALLIALAMLALPASSFAATSRPKFAPSYRGVITGSSESSNGALTFKAQWTIRNVVFRLKKVGSFEGGWTGTYMPTHGTVTYSETSTGRCSHSVKGSFPIAKALPHPLISVPLALDKDPLGRFSVLGLLDVARKFRTTETCPDEFGGEPETNQIVVTPPTLFDPGETPWRPGRVIRGHRTLRDSSSESKSTRRFSWNLKPGR
jgi:hypothetical protein